jgi:multiple sugar transport system ATP-binding protein
VARLELAGFAGAGFGPLDLAVGDGELLVLLAPAGGGKSALVRAIVGLAAVAAGTLRLDGQDATAWAPGERDLAVAFADAPLYPHLSVRDNLAFGLRLVPVAEPEVRARVEEIARLLEVRVHLDRSPAQLSFGQRQRVALGRALVRRPAAYLLDEPLSGQQEGGLRGRMRAAIAAERERTGTTCLYATASVTDALALGGRVAVLRRGRVEQTGTAAELTERPASAFVAALLGASLVPAAVEDGELRLGPARVPVDRPDGTVLAGVRPEDLAEDGAGSVRFPGPVTGSEWTGGQPLVALRYAGGTVPVLPELREELGEAAGNAAGDRLLARAKPGAGDRRMVTAQLDPARVLLFDPETGAALGRQ